MNAARQAYLEHAFFVAMRRNPDDPIAEFLDPTIFPSHQIANYMPETMRIAYRHFKLQKRYDLIRKYRMNENEREEVIA